MKQYIVLMLVLFTLMPMTSCSSSSTKKTEAAENVQTNQVEIDAQRQQDSIREAQATAERLKREEEARIAAEQEARENEKNKIVGTYEFKARIPNTDNVVTGYSNGKFIKESRMVGTIDGVEYLVVFPDERVSLISPGNRKTYIGKVNEIFNGAFSVRCFDKDSKFGHGYKLYRSGREIGTSGDTYGGYKTFVVDTNTRCVYESVDDYKNRDISDVMYIMYDSFSSTVSKSNNTEWQRNYFDQYRDKYND